MKGEREIEARPLWRVRDGDDFWRICDVDTDPIHAASQPPSNECVHLFIHSITFCNIWAYIVLKTEHGFVKGEALGPCARRMKSSRRIRGIRKASWRSGVGL